VRRLRHQVLARLIGHEARSSPSHAVARATAGHAILELMATGRCTARPDWATASAVRVLLSAWPSAVIRAR
jgi:hypothetical protein